MAGDASLNHMALHMLVGPLSAALASALAISWLQRKRPRHESALHALALAMRGDHIERDMWSELTTELSALQREHGLSPHLLFVTATETGRAHAARERSILARELPGLLVSERQLPGSIRTDALIHIVRTLNADPTVQAVCLQLPLPANVDTPRVFAALCAEKDAMGMGALNIRELCLKLGKPIAAPPIAAACVEALERSGIVVEGKRAVVLGRSSTVGGPIAQLLLRNNATVTIVHSFTLARDVPSIVRAADIVITATNVPRSLPGAWLKRGCAVIDLGKGRAPFDAVYSNAPKEGDLRLDEAMSVAAFVAPAHNGVDRLRLPMLARNVLDCTRASLDALPPAALAVQRGSSRPIGVSAHLPQPSPERTFWLELERRESTHRTAPRGFVVPISEGGQLSAQTGDEAVDLFAESGSD